MSVLEVYDDHGIRFRYPPFWEVQEQENEDQLMITVSSPGTSFWSVGLFHAKPSPAEVAEAVLSALREEYEELDAYAVHEEFCHSPAIGYDIEFFCMELLNSAWIRAFEARDFTVLVLYQADDTELEDSEQWFDVLCRSLQCAHADTTTPDVSDYLHNQAVEEDDVGKDEK